MPQIIKPSNLSLTWASAGDVLDPGNTKYATGWQVEIPPRQWFNYLDNRQDTAIAHINQHGVAVWDATTEYQANKSYVQGSTNGTVYRCVQTHTNQNPETDISNTYWIIAFASAGDFYTKVQSDANYLAKAQNLFDLPNVATARTNLSVYAKAETYTKTEVDAKTTIASTAQAQAWNSNTTLLTPLRLAEAFQGANQSLGVNGFVRLPNGLLLQWGQATADASGKITGSWPTAFTTAVYQAIANSGAGATGTTTVKPACIGSATTLSTYTFWQNTAAAGNVINFIVVGK